jgi:hypothetical protein
MSRDDYLAWARDRAFALADDGRCVSAIGSFADDVAARADTKDILRHPL